MDTPQDPQSRRRSASEQSPDVAAEVAADALALGERPAGGVGLSLSGGGYRAMVFHLGALRRLNEAGRLAQVTRVGSVSGGSITAGVLALAWTDLDFDSAGVA
ncbi:MAG: patatin-like phospholipase family protein, partial [Dermatophilaceae bacterium]